VGRTEVEQEHTTDVHLGILGWVNCESSARVTLECHACHPHGRSAHGDDSSSVGHIRTTALQSQVQIVERRNSIHATVGSSFNLKQCLIRNDEALAMMKWQQRGREQSQVLRRGILTLALQIRDDRIQLSDGRTGERRSGASETWHQV